jgi:four helix bundle protein
MQNPHNLRVTAEAEELAFETYIATRKFPRDERFVMIPQMRRAAVSIGSKIFEGCGRQGDTALLPFLHNAIGSCGELQFQIRLATRLNFGAPTQLAALADRADKVHQMLARLMPH